MSAPLVPLSARLQPRRPITGMSAVLLPYDAEGNVDWAAFDAHVERTAGAGLTPAVNMDTGYGALLGPDERRTVLDRTRRLLGPAEFVAGAYVDDDPGATFDPEAHRRALAVCAEAGAIPIVFPCHGLASLPDGAVADAHAAIGAGLDRFLAFELGPMFLPTGRIYSTATYRALLDVDGLIGAKHSSLRRDLELTRLDLRDAHRPDFLVLTGNDLAIDMVVYGSDYLLGLATFAPDAFARRDAAWAEGDELTFWALNDLLQYLGQFAFRAPVPAYKHDAARFLHLRGQIATARTHPASPTRPDADDTVLAQVLERLDDLLTPRGGS